MNSEGIRTASGEGKWYASTVSSILSNEKYCGDLLLQKYYVPDYITHKTVKNTGQLPQYYVEDHHDPIVPKEVFFQTQGELMRRGALKDDPTKIRFGSTKALCRRLICPYCGRALKRVQRGDKVEWRCRYQGGEAKSGRYSGRSKCGCRVIEEFEAEEAIVDAFNILPEFRDELIRKQAGIVCGELKRIDALMDQAKEMEMKLEEQKVRIEAEGGETEFFESEIEMSRRKREGLILERAEFASQELQVRFLLELIEEIDESEREGPDFNDETQESHTACRDYEDFFRWTRKRADDGVIEDGEIIRFDNDLVIRYLDRVVVENVGFEVWFKAGISVRV